MASSSSAPVESVHTDLDLSIRLDLSLWRETLPPESKAPVSQRPLLPGPNSSERVPGPESSELFDRQQSISGSISHLEPLIRRGHTKSRRGCYNCKRRRVKCPENHPICTQCSRKGLECRWPDIQIQRTDYRNSVPIHKWASSSPSIPDSLQSSTPVFTMQDFRLFYHFIQDAHPHHPIGNEAVWTHEVPSIAHNHEYLLHSMLALAASDLAAQAPDSSDFTCTAISERVSAINALNRALSDGLHTVEQGNAMLATCYTLIFQSVLIEDGLAEYMTFVRGCVVIAFHMGYKKLRFLFQNLIGEEQLETMEPRLQEAPGIDPDIITAACTSLESFAPLCQQGYEALFHKALVEMARAAFVSSREAYAAQMRVYGHFSYTMSHADFQSFINPSNAVGHLLQCYFVALQLMLSPVSAREPIERKRSTRNFESVRWLVALHRNIRPDMRHYYEWTISRAEAIMSERRCL